eukprot:CAMPEP_0198335004 /NCGR_PEP_ID=MMETSP1450-20131203/20004_1 /TAXON_ID=753684 ORGANISM="Madagascaria erythrocladiodes, Strain CCMP3234" /NCGR_SAMPLE_ID=MMETSP1450 /ASSEMBLY_ACC=CAM_ASM_001115 /LENGTH=510 /DNA_ID=CAMNT_0044039631 /DNA_START=154 /DNA_END=1686 /DNA_ORIENTATION=-
MRTSALQTSAAVAEKPSKLARPGSNDVGEKSKVLTNRSINPRVLEMQYAVRGAIVLRGQQLAEELRSGVHNLPFDEVVFCNIGNPHSVGGTPITFLRQVLAGCAYPPTTGSMPTDVQERVGRILEGTGGSGIGAYSESKGLRTVRQSVARFIEERDGAAPGSVNPENLFLSNGASDGIKLMLSMIIRSPSDGILIPIPQYPLYSASITLLGGAQIPYFLDEDNGWSLSVEALQQAVDKARAGGIEPRALAVINPGNPTGQVMDYQNIQDVINFCCDNNLLILADEVYQTNIYQPDERPFVSFRRVATEMSSEVELASFHSISKGMLGECGLRGGYFEMLNFSEEARAQAYKCCSVSLCSNLPGQVAMDVMVNPPRPGDESFDLYNREMQEKFASLQRKAARVAKVLNSFDGVSCQPSAGAMYAFPRISLPPMAVAAAEASGKSPDAMYAMALLENTGICVVPGAGFGQAPGTWHFRTTFLPPEDKIDSVLERMKKFHALFMRKYTLNTSL